MKPDKMAIRRKIMGAVLRGVRLARKRTLEACAEVLGCTGEEIAQYERGERDISLPELEALAQFLQVPVADVIAGRMPSLADEPPTLSSQARLLRAKIIGALLRKARLEAGKTVEEVAAEIECPPEMLERYEKGQEALSVLQLERAAEVLGVPFATFVQAPEMKPVPASLVQKPADDLAHLPPEVREFLSAPRNVPYVQVAMELSRFSAQGLRAIAEALLAAQSFS